MARTRTRARLRTPAVIASAAALLAVTGCGAADMTKQASPFAAPRTSRP